MRCANSIKEARLWAVIFATVISCGGCPRNNPKVVGGHGRDHEPHNLANLHCDDPHVPKYYSVEVMPNKQVLKDLDNLVIFVCEADSIDWNLQGSPQDFTKVLKVTFTDTFAGELFEKSETQFTVISGEHRNPLDAHKIKKQGQHERHAYKYTLEIDDEEGNCLWKLDPHVIPMGK
jgi:hypothetical protein